MRKVHGQAEHGGDEPDERRYEHARDTLSPHEQPEEQRQCGREQHGRPKPDDAGACVQRR